MLLRCRFCTKEKGRRGGALPFLLFLFLNNRNETNEEEQMEEEEENEEENEAEEEGEEEREQLQCILIPFLFI